MPLKSFPPPWGLRYSKKEKDSEFTSILLKLENTALDSFAASIGL